MERFLDLNINRENELQNIVILAAEACQTPAAYLILLGDDGLKFQFNISDLLSHEGLDPAHWSIDLKHNEVLVVENTLLDPEFAHHPAVVNEPNIRFYAGVPLVTHDGQNIGSLYVLGQQAKPLSERRRHMLQLLARQAVSMVEFELSLGILKEQYHEAKNSENKLRSFFESSKSSHVLIGRNMEVITFNKTFYDIAFQVFGKGVTAGNISTDFIYPAYVNDFIAHVQTALNGEMVSHERLIHIAGIDPTWLKITYNPTYDNAGKIIGVSFNSTDITKRKQDEEKILKQNEALRQIAYLQSHGLRKPVASILGLMHLLKLENNAPDSDVLNMMEKAVLELDQTIHQIVKNTETQTEASTRSPK
jgi:PAS domain S-box-containing protein